jgi:nucleotide-binding universal stress UspA family protein
MSMEDKDRYLQDERNIASQKLADYISAAGLGSVTPMVCYETRSTPYEILKVADAEEVDLIVLSTRGRSGLAKFLIGSVAEEVLRISSIDVLAVPPAQ